MEVEELQTQGSTFTGICNGRVSVLSKIGGQNGEDKYQDRDEGGLAKRSSALHSELVTGGALGRFCGWPASRIVRVSRASGGKDRHSKVWTSKGLRDRRVRLSVHTAIQFYDLQDRLGYDQPSKAVEWLLNAAAKSIDELPSIKTSFPGTPNQLSDERRSSVGTEPGLDSAEVEMEADANDPTQHRQPQQQHSTLSKSAGSSTSETSKGSGISFSRSDNRIKARVRAKERRAEREETEGDSHILPNHLNVNTLSQGSFTELLTSSIHNSSSSSNNGSNVEAANLFQKPRQWSSPLMDYFPMPAMPFSVGGDPQHHHPQELQHFSLIPDHMMPVATAAAGNGDYNLNFTMSSSSGLAGINRGTLQSNSPSSLLPYHFQRLSPLDGSGVPFFIGTAASNASTVENLQNHHHHHQFPAGLDGRLQLCYNGDSRHLDHKGKGKN